MINISHQIPDWSNKGFSKARKKPQKVKSFYSDESSSESDESGTDDSGWLVR